MQVIAQPDSGQMQVIAPVKCMKIRHNGWWCLISCKGTQILQKQRQVWSKKVGGAGDVNPGVPIPKFWDSGAQRKLGLHFLPPRLLIVISLLTLCHLLRKSKKLRPLCAARWKANVVAVEGIQIRSYQGNVKEIRRLSIPYPIITFVQHKIISSRKKHISGLHVRMLRDDPGQLLTSLI